MTAPSLSLEQQQAALRLGANGRHAEVLTLLADWPKDVERSPQLSLAYGTAHVRLGRNADGLRWVEHALSGARSAGDGAIERRALNARGAIALAQGRTEEGVDFFTQGLIAACRDDDLPAIGRCANNLGIVANIQGRHAEALSSYAMALAAHEAAGLPAGIAECSHNIGITKRELGDLDGALAASVSAADAARAAGEQNLVALVVCGRAEIRIARGELGLADDEAAEALAVHRALQDPVQVANDLRVVAAVRSRQGRGEEAEAMLRDVIAEARALGRPQLVAEASRDLSMLLHATGRWAEARVAAREAKAIFTSMGADQELRQLAAFEWDQEFGAEMRRSLRPLHEAQKFANSGRYEELLAYLAALAREELERSPTLLLLKAVGHARLGQMDAASAWALSALMRARMLGDRTVEVRALNVSGAIALERGGIGEATQYFARAQEEAMLAGDLATVGRAANNLGVIASLQGEYGRAVGSHTTAVGAFQRARNEQGVAEAHHNLGIAYRDQGRLFDALRSADDAVREATNADDASLRAQALAGRAEIRTVHGDAELAIREARLALEVHRALNDHVRVREDERILANALAATGQVDDAAGILTEVVAWAESAERPLLLASALRDLALLGARRGDAEGARDLAQRARGVFVRLGASAEVEKLDRLLSRLSGTSETP